MSEIPSNAPSGPRLVAEGERSPLLERLKDMDFEELQILAEAIADRQAELILELEETIESQHALLLEAADFYAEQGRLPNLPAEKSAFAAGEREADPAGSWAPVNQEKAGRR